MTQILKTLVGSRAHGLHRADSDYDYRGVYVTPTRELLRLGREQSKGIHWVEGAREDDTSYEIEHFLNLARRSNPSILEVFAAPVVESTPLGEELRALFPYVWSSRQVVEAFDGYSRNQRKKFFGDKYEFRERKWKYASAYIRTLIQGIYLIRTGNMWVKVPAYLRDDLIAVRRGEWSIGQVVDKAENFRTGLYDAFERAQEEGRENHVDLDKLNEFLLRVRREYWD